MTAPSCKVTLPVFVERYGDRLRAYRVSHPAWGALHVCLHDGNWSLLSEEDATRAEDRLDPEGAALVRAVLDLSPSQRARLEGKL